MISLILRGIIFYFVYRLVRNLINVISDQKGPVKPSQKKSNTAQRGPVIEAEYRVLSNKD